MDLEIQNIIIDSKMGPTINHNKMMNDQSIISYKKIDSLFVHSLEFHLPPPSRSLSLILSFFQVTRTFVTVDIWKTVPYSDPLDFYNAE